MRTDSRNLRHCKSCATEVICGEIYVFRIRIAKRVLLRGQPTILHVKSPKIPRAICRIGYEFWEFYPVGHAVFGARARPCAPRVPFFGFHYLYEDLSLPFLYPLSSASLSSLSLLPKVWAAALPRARDARFLIRPPRFGSVTLRLPHTLARGFAALYFFLCSVTRVLTFVTPVAAVHHAEEGQVWRGNQPRVARFAKSHRSHALSDPFACSTPSATAPPFGQVS